MCGLWPSLQGIVREADAGTAAIAGIDVDSSIQFISTLITNDFPRRTVHTGSFALIAIVRGLRSTIP